MTRSLSALGTSCSFMNSRTLFSMSWYLAVADVICWMMVVTCPNMVAYSSAADTNRAVSGAGAGARSGRPGYFTHITSNKCFCSITDSSTMQDTPNLKYQKY